MSLDDLELQLRKLPGVQSAAFSETDDTVLRVGRRNRLPTDHVFPRLALDRFGIDHQKAPSRLRRRPAAGHYQ